MPALWISRRKVPLNLTPILLIDMSSIDLLAITFDSMRMIAAFVLALPIAWEREQATRIMGLRTFPLVAVGSCAYILIGESVIGDSGDARARLIQGLVSGLGFIGGGAILKDGDRVQGTATAASVWTTGAIGTAVGFRRYEIAVVLVLLNFAILWWFTRVKEYVGEDD